MDHGSLFVYKVKVEELAATLGVLPLANGSLFDDSRLDGPVVGKLVEGLDGHER